ncbi:MAG: uncharacterized protein QOI06_995 [Nocardioidaceae bacterium]|jgi:uncharacterized protein YqeY|nr:uncharacterized protein [Nocardioidaceae bacterium]
MATLKARLRSELTASMKARDALRSSTLRMLLTAVTNAEVSGKQARELSDEDVVGVLATENKKRREAATAYEEAGRQELAEKEQAEGAIIAEFLPAPLSADQIASLVSETIARLGVADDGMRAMGKVMGALAPQTLGRADGAVVSAEVRRQLAG